MARGIVAPTVRAGEARLAEAAANPQVQAAANYVSEVVDPAVMESWMQPLEGPSRAVGAVIEGRDPLAAASDPGMSEPNLSETLIERGWSPGAAGLMEFLVPDPTGVGGRAMDMVPIVAGLLRFGRSFRNSGNATRQILADAVERLAQGAPADTSTYFDDLYNYARSSGIQVQSELSNPRLSGWHLGDVIRLQTPDSRITLDHYGESAVVRTVESLANAGKGDASAQMRAFLPVLDLADANDMRLYTFPDPFGPNADRNSAQQLGEMYERLGFQYISDPGGPNDGWMVRAPLPVTEDESARFAALAARRKNEVDVFGQPLEPTNEQFHEMADAADLEELMRYSDEIEQAANEGANYARVGQQWTDPTKLDERFDYVMSLADSNDINDVENRLTAFRNAVESDVTRGLTPEEAQSVMQMVDERIANHQVRVLADSGRGLAYRYSPDQVKASLDRLEGYAQEGPPDLLTRLRRIRDLYAQDAHMAPTDDAEEALRLIDERIAAASASATPPVAPSVTSVGQDLADRYDVVASQADELRAIAEAGIASNLTRAEADRLFFNVDSLIQDLAVLDTPEANDRILFLEETKRMIQNLIDPVGGA